MPVHLNFEILIENCWKIYVSHNPFFPDFAKVTRKKYIGWFWHLFKDKIQTFRLVQRGMI